jgi:hypothetical protein
LIQALFQKLFSIITPTLWKIHLAANALNLIRTNTITITVMATMIITTATTIPITTTTMNTITTTEGMDTRTRLLNEAHLLQEKSHLNEIGKKERLLLALEGLLVAEKPL